MRRFAILLVLAAATGGAAGFLHLSAEEPSPEPDGYRLAAGDRVEVRVYGDAGLNGTFRVPVDGGVTFPLIGELRLRARTTGEVRAEVERRLREGDFLENPSVAVLVQDFAPRVVFVLGEVRSSGSYEIPFGGELKLSHLLSLAGGLTPEADADRILLHRRASGGGPSAYSYHSLPSGGEGLNPLLSAGDQVFVRRQPTITIMGAVNRAGEVPYRDGLTLSEALGKAGGPRMDADLRITLLHPDGRGGRQPVEIDLKKILDGEATDPKVYGNALIFVRDRRFW